MIVFKYLVGSLKNFCFKTVFYLKHALKKRSVHFNKINYMFTITAPPTKRAPGAEAGPRPPILNRLFRGKKEVNISWQERCL